MLLVPVGAPLPVGVPVVATVALPEEVSNSTELPAPRVQTPLAKVSVVPAPPLGFTVMLPFAPGSRLRLPRDWLLAPVLAPLTVRLPAPFRNRFDVEPRTPVGLTERSATSEPALMVVGPL